ncbi:MAG TPA: amidohydrolase family protein [Streptosporangiaceae bacterium]|nr:amidohydrolase family protein [Streptosporangiaceae bacterium]
MSNSTTIFANGQFLDVETGGYTEGDLRSDDGIISEIGPQLATPTAAERVDLRGAFVLPGLIDSHVHIMASTADLADLASWPVTYNAYHTARLLGQMLDRGFTTVRDMAGGDYGTWRALEEGLVRGPRLFYAGRALSQTGGHGDHRGPGEHLLDTHPACGEMSAIVDGVDQVRKAAREELRRGAHHIKVMAGGGVASPTDRIDSTQFSLAELTAAVEEATAARRYVAAHAYTPDSISRALHAGVRTIEHANLLDPTTAELVSSKQAFLVMNLVTYWALQWEGREFGLPEASWRKVTEVLDAGLHALELAHTAGIKIGYGTDLLGGMHRHQSQEFVIRRQIQAPLDIIRSATTVGAEIVGLPGKLGTLAPGAFADLVALTRDPLDGIAALADPASISYVVKNGTVELTNP